ncbi:MAG: C-GCAxxG-C-C family protein [Lachnospiraceae bacterium]|nr:C-GCAxxG-C-C family protein [Lachnospiraceae bacterium]
MNIEERAQLAVEYKTRGRLNCAQAVTAALADETGLDKEVLNNITAGFGVGMGNMEATCGALVGAGMVVGMKTEGKGTLPLNRKLIEGFRDKCGAVKCRDLKTVGEDGKPLCPCDECVRNAVLTYGEIMG